MPHLRDVRLGDARLAAFAASRSCALAATRRAAMTSIRIAANAASRMSGIPVNSFTAILETGSTAMRHDGTTEHRLPAKAGFHIAVVSPLRKLPDPGNSPSRDYGKTDCRVYGFTALRRGA
jgi:hypothetical protein